MGVKNPQEIDKVSDCPTCFGEYDENNSMCTNHCPFSGECSNETELENEHRNLSKEVDGKPICFGTYFSPIGPSCLFHCKAAKECEAICERDVNQSLERPTIATSLAVLTGASSKVSSTAIRSPSLAVIDNPYRAATTPTYYNGYTTVPAQTMNNNVPGLRQPAPLTNEQALALYGVGLHRNPVLPGQFDGEPWYERFGKLFVLNTGESAIRVFSELIITMLRQIHWSPKK